MQEVLSQALQVVQMVTTKHLLVCIECGETFGGPNARYMDSHQALKAHRRKYKHGPEHVQADAIDRARANLEPRS